MLVVLGVRIDELGAQHVVELADERAGVHRDFLFSLGGEVLCGFLPCRVAGGGGGNGNCKSPAPLLVVSAGPGW